MKNWALLFLLFLMGACQSVRLESETYKISKSTTELGSMGKASFNGLKHTFETKSFPVLENKIRLDVKVLPLNKKVLKVLSKSYSTTPLLKKKKDSIALPLNTAQSIIVISVLDVTAYLEQLNASQNEQTVTYLKNTKRAKLVNSVAIVVNDDLKHKIKQADTYYLLNSQDHKYVLALYKEGKKLENAELFSESVLGYKLSKFCWASTTKNKWFVADFVPECSSCKGKTYRKIKKDKKNKSLFKM